MSLSADEVRHVATLARLEISEEEVPLFAEQLSKILDHIAQLDEPDTENVEPTSHPLDLKNVFRKDETKKPFEDGAWKINAPSEDHGHMRVPKVLDE